MGEEALAAVAGLRLSSATAITACTALKITREEMIRVMHEEHAFSDLFLKFLLARSMRVQADLVDQLFNSSEKRLGQNSSVDGRIRQTGRAGDIDSKNLARDIGGNDWHHAIPCELLHEPISQARLY